MHISGLGKDGCELNTCLIKERNYSLYTCQVKGRRGPCTYK